MQSEGSRARAVWLVWKLRADTENSRKRAIAWLGKSSRKRTAQSFQNSRKRAGDLLLLIANPKREFSISPVSLGCAVFAAAGTVTRF